MSPFEALYRYSPLLHIPYFPKDSNIAAVDLLMRDKEFAADRMKKLAVF